MHGNSTDIFINLIRECSEFLERSHGCPLKKYLPETYADIHRVKVRKRQGSDQFNRKFNEAFDKETHLLRQRAVFANGTQAVEEGQEMFYILPPNGFKFLYSTEVENSSKQYQSVFESILDVDDGETFKELLKFTYTSDNLQEGLEAGAEIIVYNIPYFYAVRESTQSYDEMLSLAGEH